MPDGHFQHQLWGNLEELGVVAIGLEQEWQHIEAASWGFPALLDADLQPEGARSQPAAVNMSPDPPDAMAMEGGAEAPMQACQQHLPLEARGHATPSIQFCLTSHVSVYVPSPGPQDRRQIWSPALRSVTFSEFFLRPRNSGGLRAESVSVTPSSTGSRMSY